MCRTLAIVVDDVLVAAKCGDVTILDYANLDNLDKNFISSTCKQTMLGNYLHRAAVKQLQQLIFWSVIGRWLLREREYLVYVSFIFFAFFVFRRLFYVRLGVG
jgi:hypothetical protein